MNLLLGLLKEIDKSHSNHMSFEDFVEELNQKYSVTLRNTASTAVNQKDDNLVDENKLRSEIESMLDDLDIERQEDYGQPMSSCIIGKEEVSEKIIKLFKTYQNSVLRQDLNQVNKYSSRGETESKIAFKNSLRHHVERLVTADQGLDQIVENIVNFFVDTVNPVFRALNDSDKQSIIK